MLILKMSVYNLGVPHMLQLNTLGKKYKCKLKHGTLVYNLTITIGRNRFLFTISQSWGHFSSESVLP